MEVEVEGRLEVEEGEEDEEVGDGDDEGIED